ncbi:MAG: enterotoxin [Steroidobacteraceae bacterium]
MTSRASLLAAAVAALGAVAPPVLMAATIDAITSIGNRTVGLEWAYADRHIAGVALSDLANGYRIPITAPFVIALKDGQSLGIEQLLLVRSPNRTTLPGNPDASRASERLPSDVVTMSFTDADNRFQIEWRLLQPQGASYIRAELTISAARQDEAIKRVGLFQAVVPGAEVVGKVRGSPVVARRDYWMFEHPLSQSSTSLDGTIRLWIERTLPLIKGQSIAYSAVAGATGAGQLRRDFLAYLEAERAHPYRTFLHYNSWYDTGYFTPYTEADALDRIQAFGEQLNRKRGVMLDSFLFDDGWDDRTGSWAFSKDFPRGFLPVRDAAAKYGAAPGVWLSPWGGYSKPKEQRVAAGIKAGYEIIDGGFALSGPRYYEGFRSASLRLLQEQGINQFKLDGTGNADKVFPGSRFDSDFDAAIALIADLRRAKPDLFINLTTGTYPSPAWLRYADSIWRDGDDHAFAGVGTSREQWITYRDRETYENVVVAGPLFPLNALMLHGIIYAQFAAGLQSDPGHDFANEVHDYFGTGTALQEMYITPSLLSASDWDVLAEAARWSRENADILKDTHWIGGNPGRLDVYGWAAWAPRKGVITLRNPDSNPRIFTLEVSRALELPAGAARRFQISSPWKSARQLPFSSLQAGQQASITLAPFQVLTMELVPK